MTYSPGISDPLDRCTKPYARCPLESTWARYREVAFSATGKMEIPVFENTVCQDLSEWFGIGNQALNDIGVIPEYYPSWILGGG
jgi:hypothetical protein